MWDAIIWIGILLIVVGVGARLIRRDFIVPDLAHIYCKFFGDWGRLFPAY